MDIWERYRPNPEERQWRSWRSWRFRNKHNLKKLVFSLFWSKTSGFLLQILLQITRECKKVGTAFFSDNRREAIVSFGSFGIYIVVEHNNLWVLKDCSKWSQMAGCMEHCSKTSGSLWVNDIFDAKNEEYGIVIIMVVLWAEFFSPWKRWRHTFLISIQAMIQTK